MKKTSTQIKVLLLVLITTGISACMKSSYSAATLPVMITYDVVIDPTSITAWSGGILTSGTSSFTAYGVCWSTTNQEPTIADSKTSEPVVLISYTSNLTGLSPNTTYYARAYATNSAGTGYGNVIKFTTGSDQSNAYKTVTTLAGSLTAGFVNGTGTAAMFNSPMGMTTDAAGNIYVSDSYNSAIRKITPAGVVTTVAGAGELGYLDGAATPAKFYSPSGLAIDASGNIFVADRGNNMIRKITPAGVVSTFAGSGNAGYTDGTGTAATFNTPSGVAFDAAGSLYVADYGNNLIRKITSAGVVTTVAGSRTAGYANGQGVAANFNKPSSIAIDAAGNIYVTEPYNNAIRKISADYTVTTFVGGPAATTFVGSPIAISIDATGNMFIADFDGRILEISAGKILTVLAGKSGTQGSTDGAGGSAMFNNPQGIVSGAGNIYVADFGNNLIRKLNSN
jgi:sugar lactone lactonase YvrE